MKPKTKIPIFGLLERYETTLTGMGYSPTTRLLLVKRAELIIRLHQNQGLDNLDPDIINDYVRGIDEKYFMGGMRKRYHASIRREINHFISYANTGNSGMLPNPVSGCRQKLLPCFEKIAEEFLADIPHPNTRCDARWAAYKYLSWLEDQGHCSLDGIGAVHIQKFLLDCAGKHSPNTVYDIRLYLKKLYAFLFRTRQSDSDFHELFSFTVNREHKVYPSLPRADIAKLLDAIDRNTVKGKRDYAIMLLGTVLGLRACDVTSMKLSDIDWMRGEIRIKQSKTAVPVLLPLTKDVGEALQDYILNARPVSDEDTIFLRIYPPHTPLAAAVTLGEIYEGCCKAAGLPASKRYHNLRRSLGTSMISNGVSVYDVAQVFGDRSVESTKPYLATDMEHLKMCALSFSGIELSGGGLG